jgi:hypothetical protein
MRSRLPFAALAVAVALTGCKRPDPAPEELSDLLMFTFSHWPVDDPTHDVSLADAGENLLDWFAAEAVTADDYDPELGYGATLIEETDRLSAEEVDTLEPPAPSGTGVEAVGVVVALETTCTLEDIERVYLDDDQLGLYPDNYTAYARRDQTDYDCFLDGDCPRATWISAIEQDLVLNITTAYELNNEMRSLDAASLDGTEVRGRLVRAWMREEAALEPGDVGRWRQNYQLEYLIEIETGVLHVYAQWNEVEISGLNTEANAFLNGYLDGLREYIRLTEEHCEEG